ncbi:MAG: vanadium-dependent haloperoxidase [Mucilaginibacter polytrichastri]|nr:vanadium-dependent haloperoxidase [Mucilaginibacter polytrichastri]
MTKYLIYTLLLTTLVLNACKKGDYRAYTGNPALFRVTEKKLNDVVLENNFPPVIASRNYAYANIAAFEVIAAGDPKKFHSMAGQIAHLKPVPKPAAKDIDFPFAALLAFCEVGNAVTFPEGSMMDYVAELKTRADSAGMPSEVMKNTEEYASVVSKHILDWSKGDNYAQTRSASKFSVRDQEGRWIPTPPMYGQALEPHWQEIRPFVIDSAMMHDAPPPVPYNMADTTSRYYKEVMALKKTGENLTDEQKHIAEFWDDLNTKLNVTGHVSYMTKKFSPPGHWMNIVGIAAQKANADFGTTVMAYAKTSIAIFDGFIECWAIKFKYNTVRPETVINKKVDPEWRPFLQTPPFPEYTCGHSTISAAAAEALTGVFGDNFAYRDSSEREFGIPDRSFKSFRAAAMENVWARFYGGIHYHYSCVEGNEKGRLVGDRVNEQLKTQVK